MARDDPEVRLRLPADLKARTEAAAREAGRSMNAEIVARLQGSFEATTERISKLEDAVFSSERGTDALMERIAEIERDVGRLNETWTYRR